MVSWWIIGIGLARADSAGDALQRISACRALSEPTARLRCFDEATVTMTEPLTPRVADFGKPPPPRPDEVAQIVATVKELSWTARGRAVFVLDNGQTWRQLEGDNVQVFEPAPGKVLKVTIGHGLVGNYTLTMEGRNGLVRVRRVQ